MPKSSQFVARGKNIKKVTNESRKLFVKRWETICQQSLKNLTMPLIMGDAIVQN
jgi:hypothetical protein